VTGQCIDYVELVRTTNEIVFVVMSCADHSVVKPLSLNEKDACDFVINSHRTMGKVLFPFVPCTCGTGQLSQ
jgi:hypothetical protein